MADGVYVEEGEYRGYPTITVFTGKVYNDKKEFVTMGVGKASAVCDTIDSIRRFVEKHQDASKRGGKHHHGRT